MENSYMNNNSTSSTVSPSNAIDRFLDAVRHGAMPATTDVYGPSVVLDATVPGWRFVLRGQDAVRGEYARWFAATSEFTELRRQTTADGEVVEYFMTWAEDGVEHGAHHAHILTIDPVADRIVEDRVFCGGRWPAPLLAEMNAPAFEHVG